MTTLNHHHNSPQPHAPETPANDPLTLAIQRLLNRTEEQMLADRKRIWESSSTPRPLPEGKSLSDVVEGTWPGDETDEEILEMLERLS